MGSRGHQDGRRAEQQQHDGAATERGQRGVGLLPGRRAGEAGCYAVRARAHGRRPGVVEPGALGGVDVLKGRRAGAFNYMHRARRGRVELQHCVTGGAASECSPRLLAVGRSVGPHSQHPAEAFPAEFAPVGAGQREAVDVAHDGRGEGE